MTTYTLRVEHVPEDVPTDVLIEHVAVALRKMQKGRRALKRINVWLESSTPTRQHPFDGPEVNDDVPFAGDSYTIFSGKREDEWEDNGIKAWVPEVPESVEVIEVELDLDDIVDKVYTAISEDFPYLSELFRAKKEDREVKRPTSITDPVPEGEWDLDSGDNVGEDV